MFRKLVAVGPVNLPDRWREELKKCASELTFYPDIPIGNAEIIRRIGDADAVLVNYTTTIDREVLAACPSLRYVGMTSSLYSPESANVDILFAAQRGITVLGVRDYGDEGVGEYVVSELVRLLHGFGAHMWREAPIELTGIPVGIVGMGTTGILVARSLRFFGAEVSYYSRTRKPELEAAEGYTYLPLEALLPRVDILCTCLNKNVVLLGEREFRLLGDGKILVNTSIGPSHEVEALAAWLEKGGNYALGDTTPAIDPSGALLERPNVICPRKSAGGTSLAYERLGRKVLENMRGFLRENP